MAIEGRSRSNTTIGIILGATTFLLTGCFSALQDTGEAWSGDQGSKAKRQALAADIVTMPIQAPLIAGAILIASPAAIKGSFETKVTVRAVDDEGAAVEGAYASFGRYPRRVDKNKPLAKGPSHQDGIFPEKVKLSEMRAYPITVIKTGHYPATLSRDSLTSFLPGESKAKDLVINIPLKRIKHPAPMYAKQIHTEIPVSGVDVGYDLAAGDWLEPHGRGKIADIVFHSVAEVKNDSHYQGELTVSFPGRGNGLMPIELPLPQLNLLRMPYEAPAEGYESKRVWRSARKYNPVTKESEENIDDSSETQNFFIRLRSELNTNGDVVRAWYGKIYAPFFYGPRGFDRNGATGKQSIRFTYYVNPDGTRNIEFDRTRNLLKPANKHDSSLDNLDP